MKLHFGEPLFAKSGDRQPAVSVGGRGLDNCGGAGTVEGTSQQLLQFERRSIRLAGCFFPGSEAAICGLPDVIDVQPGPGDRLTLDVHDSAFDWRVGDELEDIGQGAVVLFEPFPPTFV